MAQSRNSHPLSMLVLTTLSILIALTISKQMLPVCELCRLATVPPSRLLPPDTGSGCHSYDGIEEECILLDEYRCYWANDSIINIGPDKTRQCRNDADCIKLDGSKETPKCLRCCKNENLEKKLCTETISTDNTRCGLPDLNIFGTTAPCCPYHTCLDMRLGICGVIAEECDECMTWTGFEDIPVTYDNCNHGLFCLTAGYKIEFNYGVDIDINTKKSKGKGRRRRLERRDQIIFDKGICVPLDGISQTETGDCEDDNSCPKCMRCCLKDGKKQCLRATGYTCGLSFEGRGPCCCPDDVCIHGECLTLSPTKSPTTHPTLAPSPVDPPTNYPTRSPLADICPYELRQGFKFDFIVLFDNSCGLLDVDCDELLEGVGEIISTLCDGTGATRVQTMQFNENGAADIIVSFNDILQNDPLQYIQFVRINGECTDGGNGQTDMVQALNDIQLYFDTNDDRIDKIIIVSACKDKRDNTICDEIAIDLSNKGIDSYIVNLIDASDANNVIKKDESETYLACVADNDISRVCPGYDQPGVTAGEFTDIIEHCLLPGICEPPTLSTK